MARTDTHLDETLRHLGAAYCDSLRGRASRSDVTRALEALQEHLKAQQRQARAGSPPRSACGVASVASRRALPGTCRGSGIS